MNSFGWFLFFWYEIKSQNLLQIGMEFFFSVFAIFVQFFLKRGKSKEENKL